MPGIKRLRSVAHSFAQHALGPFSPFTPERTLEQRRSAVECISVALIGDDTSNREVESLSIRFAEFLDEEHLTTKQIIKAKVDFLFKGQCRTPSYCKVTIQTADGRIIEDTVDVGLRRLSIGVRLL